MKAKKRSLMQKSALVLSMGAVLFLSGCQSVGTVSEPEAPAPVETAAVKLVKGTHFALDDTVSVEEVFSQYGSCRPGSLVWEEIEKGDVQLSCRYEDGSIVQFDFAVDDAQKVSLKMVTLTTMNDAEFAGVSLRGPDADDMLKRVYFNQKLF